LSWRRVAELIRWLPPDSALAVSMYGAPSTWSTEAHLLAAAVDALQVQIWQQSKKGTPRPRPIPRPGVQAQGQTTYGRRRGMTTAELDRRLAEKRKKVAADGD
jgi:hypothetical protein